TPMMARVYVGLFHARGRRSLHPPPPLPPKPIPPPPSSNFIGRLVGFNLAATVIGLPPRDTVSSTVSPASLLRSTSRTHAAVVAGSLPTLRTASPSLSPAASAGESGATASITGLPALSLTT